MRVAIYSPYLDTFGGGERYILSIAECLATTHRVDLLFDQHLWSQGSEKLKKDLATHLNIDLSRVYLIKAPLGKGSKIWERLIFFRQYDYLFYLTDGSIFLSTAKNSILHFQVPFKNIAAQGIWGKRKLKSWKMAIYNSQFTKQIVEKTWDIKGTIIYPPVDVESFKPLKKKKIILSVGRFFGYLKSKKHEEMIKAFHSLYYSQRMLGWSLHLAGAARSGDQVYLKNLQDMVGSVPVFFHPNISFNNLKTFYGQASIYWHAAGFGEKNPTKQEHFGITTVEAMAAGAVPVVIASGGQKEIVEDGKSGFLWKRVDELKKYTMELVQNEKLFHRLSQNAINRSKIFSKEEFCRQIKKIVYEN